MTCQTNFLSQIKYHLACHFDCLIRGLIYGTKVQMNVVVICIYFCCYCTTKLSYKFNIYFTDNLSVTLTIEDYCLIRIVLPSMTSLWVYGLLKLSYPLHSHLKWHFISCYKNSYADDIIEKFASYI